MSNVKEVKFSEADLKRCFICAMRIKAYGDIRRRTAKRFCSRVCRGIYQTKVGVEKRQCSICNKGFEVKGSQKTKGMGYYCSVECYGLSKRSQFYKPRSENKAIRDSKEYKHWRISVFKRDDYRCLDCGERGGRLHADHIHQFAHYPRLRLDINNGQTLCIECHRKTPTYGGRRSKI